MTDTPNRPPLWEAMDRADRNIKLSAEQNDWPRYIKAAEIRALRDWLVPEESEAPVGDSEPWPLPYQHRGVPMWEQRQLLRALLTTEADRAEAGDV